MKDFKNMLILSYFFQYKEEYLLSQLQMILGLTISQLENRITELMKSELLRYEGHLLSITTKGIQFVLSRNMEVFPFEIDNSIQINDLVQTYEVLPINDVYIPKNFMKKVKR